MLMYVFKGPKKEFTSTILDTMAEKSFWRVFWDLLLFNLIMGKRKKFPEHSTQLLNNTAKE